MHDAVQNPENYGADVVSNVERSEPYPAESTFVSYQSSQYSIVHHTSAKRGVAWSLDSG